MRTFCIAVDTHSNKMSWFLSYKQKFCAETRKKINYDSPIVLMNVVLKASSENLKSIHVFPTPESPISNNLNR